MARAEQRTGDDEGETDEPADPRRARRLRGAPALLVVHRPGSPSSQPNGASLETRAVSCLISSQRERRADALCNSASHRRAAAIKTRFSLGFFVLAMLSPIAPPSAAGDQEPGVVIAVLADLQEVHKGKTVPAYASIAAQRPDLLVLAGDLDHRFGKPFDRLKVQRMHCEVHGRTGSDCAGARLWPAGQDWLTYLEGIPLVGVPDDHDGNGNNSDRTTPGWPIVIEEYQDRKSVV